MKNNSWPKIPLETAFWFQEGPGVRKWQFRDSGIKLLNVSNILKDGTLDLSNSTRFLDTNEVQAKYSHFLADKGDLVIASSGISFDSDNFLRTRAAFIEEEHLSLCMNTSTIRFKPKTQDSDLRFLRHWISSFEFRSQITRTVTGSAQQNFGPSHLKQIIITLPPVEEQRRIAAILDKAEELRAKRRQAIAKLDALTQSIFIDMFGDPVMEPNRWPTRPIIELFSIRGGGTPSKSISDYWNGRIPWASPKDMKTEILTTTVDTISESGVRNSSTVYANPGDVLIVYRSGILVHTFPVCVAGNSLTINQDLKVLSASGEVSNEFLFGWLRTAEALLLSCVKRGATVHNVDGNKFRMLEIPIPPSTLQKKWAANLRSIRKLKSMYNDSEMRLVRLFDSLQMRAFKGEL